MITDGTNSFVAFLYVDGLIQLITGDALGGTDAWFNYSETPAQVHGVEMGQH